MPTMTNFHGLIPAMAVPFRADFSIDEQELTSFARWLAAQPGVVGMMTNGHTGEVFSLTPRERAEVTRIAARAVDGTCPVISSIVCEGIKDAIEQAGWATDAGGGISRKDVTCGWFAATWFVASPAPAPKTSWSQALSPALIPWHESASTNPGQRSLPPI